MAKPPSELHLTALPCEVQDLLRAAGILHCFAAGEILFLQDEPCAGLFFVERGTIKISKTSAEGREQVLRFVSAGGSFNEVSVFDGGPNPATATAAEPSEVLLIPAHAVLRLMQEAPELASAMVLSLSSRLRHLVVLVEDLSFRHVSERVARILLQSVTPHPGVGAGVNLARRVTQREIAEMAGTSREVVTRALKELEATGAITVERGEIRLIEPDRLSHLN